MVSADFCSVGSELSSAVSKQVRLISPIVSNYLAFPDGNVHRDLGLEGYLGKYVVASRDNEASVCNQVVQHSLGERHFELGLSCSKLEERILRKTVRKG